MQVVMFYHSLISDWNHDNAHFLRGIVMELRSRGHEVQVYEPANSWSLNHLLADHGMRVIQSFRKTYPKLDSIRYDPRTIDLYDALYDADLVIVHEWNDPRLISRIGKIRAGGGRFHLLFHDTHHRSLSDPRAIAQYDLSAYDGVLALGECLRQRYVRSGQVRESWTWHEAADTRVFKPVAGVEPQGDVVWVGNWGDGQRAEELNEFLIQPVKELGLKAKVYGARYPEHAIEALREAGIEYGGWIPNYQLPEVFARFRVTLHVPSRFYARVLPGVPTLRPFEALACGIPLVSAPWDDCERLFSQGKDFLVAHDKDEMKSHLRALLNDPDYAAAVASHGRKTLLRRHTCGHRVDQLLSICFKLKGQTLRRRGTQRRWVTV